MGRRRRNRKRESYPVVARVCGGAPAGRRLRAGSSRRNTPMYNVTRDRFKRPQSIEAVRLRRSMRRDWHRRPGRRDRQPVEQGPTRAHPGDPGPRAAPPRPAARRRCRAMARPCSNSLRRTLLYSESYLCIEPKNFEVVDLTRPRLSHSIEE